MQFNYTVSSPNVTAFCNGLMFWECLGFHMALIVVTIGKKQFFFMLWSVFFLASASGLRNVRCPRGEDSFFIFHLTQTKQSTYIPGSRQSTKHLPSCYLLRGAICWDTLLSKPCWKEQELCMKICDLMKDISMKRDPCLALNSVQSYLRTQHPLAPIRYSPHCLGVSDNSSCQTATVHSGPRSAHFPPSNFFL